MLLHKKGRFYAGGISFALPDDCCLIIFEAQNYYENGFEITDRQETVVIDICLNYGELPAKDFLDDIVEGDVFTRLSDTTPIQAGELYGYRVFYQSKNDRYCEYRFDLPENHDINALDIFVRVERGGIDIFEAGNSEMVLQLLGGIRKDAI